jgi:hypothetical protein
MRTFKGLLAGSTDVRSKLGERDGGVKSRDGTDDLVGVDIWRDYTAEKEVSISLQPEFEKG